MDQQTLALIATIITSVGTLTWWLSNQFKETRKYVQDTVDNLEKLFFEKLEYHERHDDKRFSDIVNSLWELRLRNAASEGLVRKAEKAKGD